MLPATGARRDPGDGLMTTLSTKQTVRADFFRRRTELPRETREAEVPAFRSALADWLAAHPGARVAAYVPVGTEPGGSDLPSWLASQGARVLLPIVLPSMDLDWSEYEPGEELVLTSRQLLEPGGTRLGRFAVAACNLVLVPALAADRRGTRLGRGAGCYDRALTRVPRDVPLVALLHDGELVAELPAEPHDRPVTAVITPSGGWCDLPDSTPALDDSAAMTHT
jgi:5-formyltetrahydrofolate cyclo-ligase